MPKNSNEPRTLKCRDCGHDRFQVHDRGRFDVSLDANEREVLTFRQDETAAQCLQCHHACLLDELVRP